MTGTVRDAVHTFLLAQGVTTVFGNPGSTEMRFFRDWPDTLNYVVAPQESSVLAMADGYAQATGGVGWLWSTQPGASATASEASTRPNATGPRLWSSPASRPGRS
ncbi:hypothetical protein GU243_00785 [Pseudarthrobacter psychrotolerans]|uniref:Thiamine pyrophosphate enzyme N-terminal TPP-binding domain-containing protein n=1 Tax=Pseudarthrobacter psychrotolerans TaxID=2697569 RepID=A0A6P1NGC0_9MICC|nr:hypothetical protein GU243_00785 [Pseudarthrobacter psychrotolerans]